MEKHSITTVEIKVVQGTIDPEDNELECESAFFYWANFVPHYDGKTIFVIGECGFLEKEKFVFKYDLETDTVSFSKKYRMCLCTPEIYNKYYLNIKREDNEQMLAIPWIRFSRTKDGISIPQLVERIFGKIPTTMVFI
jgi:hypothetical protein